MSRLTKDAYWTSDLGGAVMLLRPYQDLFYYDAPLRQWLARLEKDFEGYDGSIDPPRVSAESGENDHNDDDTGSPTRESSVSISATQHVVAEMGSSGQSNIDHESVPHRNQDKTSDRADDDPESSDEDSDSDEDGFSARDKTLANSITALIHLRSLLEFVDNEIKPRREYVESTMCSHVSFQDLWHLFNPGTEVIDQGGKQAFVVLRVEVPAHKIEEPWGRWSKRLNEYSEEQATKDRSHFTLHCACIDFDGKNFGPVSKAFIISPFGDLKPVVSLPIYPVRFKGQETRQNLIRRGRLLLEVADFKAMYYTGATLDKGDEIDSQVVIDFSEALADEQRSAAWKPTICPVNTAPEDRRHVSCNAICCRFHGTCDGFMTDLKMTTDYIESLVPDPGGRSLILSPRSLEETIGSTEELTETELLIMTYRVFGFVLRSRKWAQLDLNLLRYENSSERDLTIDAFERLELPEGHRELVQSLVTQHFRNRQSSFTRDEQTDLIKGKGKGLIMLLHGAPGVGKTTTAEGIAELFRKPLFQITCGDLGTTAKEVEEDLERSFALASRWGCILLLDEADVFLAARSKNDFARNGLVAVFLRVLEYYTGTLFLTTNRIGDLDEAFASRIQMSLHYPELDELKILKVFRLHLDLIEQRFKKQGRTIAFDISSVEDFASQHYADQPYNRWNGRQIRNACHTALALAEFDAQKNGSEINLEIDKSAPVSLQLKYFKIVQKAYLDFGEYLADIQGTEGDDRAFQQRLRARKSTPFEKQSLFDSRPGPAQRRRPHHANSRLSDMSPSFTTKTEVFHHDQHRHQRQYSSTASSQAQGYGNAAPYNQTPGGSFRDYGNSPAHDQQMHGQQAQTDTRFPMERQQAPLYESPQAGLQPAHSGEAHLHPSMSHDGSPLPLRPAQPQSMQYGYNSELQADAMRSTTPRVQSDPREIPHPGHTYRDGAQSGPNRVPYQGGNMPQT
ncbi:hypothetical protein CGCSCA4_v003733 [Colletotrichum siamense]|uniref:AAA+ ATPase domain-containing protein n=1 Tax=Colletotrichum siamense TaxID=690259 RepID=A0A9P5EZ38_COLSI|nr:hypothetical protein CGCSCA4_v003733 [Colletotrichum siamense]KAF4862428.1 hypothetical protein CGCSCA2_v003479 [Colletotrichum siamense]